MPASVDALLPLSLLEAVRDIDTPASDFETEFVPELRNKRFGLSETVYAQIRRYTDDVRRHHPTPLDEAVALARLIGRRPDAEAVFREAGRRVAQSAYVTVSPFTRRVLRGIPRMFSRPLALRRASGLARRYLRGTVSRRGSTVLLEIPASVTADAAPRAAGCAYYESALHEMLRLLTGTSNSVEHVRCSARGEGSDQWRAEWAR
jgi:hypothetical protein